MERKIVSQVRSAVLLWLSWCLHPAPYATERAHAHPPPIQPPSRHPHGPRRDPRMPRFHGLRYDSLTSLTVHITNLITQRQRWCNPWTSTPTWRRSFACNRVDATIVALRPLTACRHIAHARAHRVRSGRSRCCHNCILSHPFPATLTFRAPLSRSKPHHVFTDIPYDDDGAVPYL